MLEILEIEFGERNVYSITVYTVLKYSWRKMETGAAADDRTEWRQVVCDIRFSGSDKP